MESHIHRRQSINSSVVCCDTWGMSNQGVGRDIKHARVLTEEDENKLWTSGVFETTSPSDLQNAVFYTVGKIFSLREELRCMHLVSPS